MLDLQKVNIVVYSDEDCKAAHGSYVDEAYHVCAGIPEGGKGQCSVSQHFVLFFVVY